MKSSVLILGHSRATLTVVRSLAAAGFRVLVGRQGTSAYSAYSRFVSEVWDHPPFRRQKDFIDSLVEFLSKRADVSYVFPVGEAELECITLHLAQIPDPSKIVMPAADVVMACLNKAQTYQMVSRLSIPFPKGENVSDLPA